MRKIPDPPTAEQYERAELATLRRFSPTVYECKTCRWPAVDGYVCTYCGDDTPNEQD